MTLRKKNGVYVVFWSLTYAGDRTWSLRRVLEFWKKDVVFWSWTGGAGRKTSCLLPCLGNEKKNKRRIYVSLLDVEEERRARVSLEA